MAKLSRVSPARRIVGDVLLARTEGIVIGLGTLLLAVLPGWLMRLTDPLVARLLKGRSGRSGHTPQ